MGKLSGTDHVAYPLCKLCSVVAVSIDEEVPLLWFSVFGAVSLWSYLFGINNDFHP